MVKILSFSFWQAFLQCDSPSHWFLLSAGRSSRTSSRRCRIGKTETMIVCLGDFVIAVWRAKQAESAAREVL